MNKKIIAAFKTHFDYGYTDLAENVLNDFCTKKLDEALNICECTKDSGNHKYIWTLPAYLLMQMTERCIGSKKRRLTALIESGQILCHALPFTMHTELLDKKLFDKMFIWTDEYVSTYGKSFPVAAKMTDVPGHTSAIIEPLVSRGVKFLHLGKNEASLAPKVPLLFWWEDLKGNRILTMYNQNYGSSLLPPRNWKYPVWLALCQTYDNAGVQDREYVDKIAEKAEQAGYEFTTGSLDDFVKELLKYDLSDLPIIKGELSNTWAHGNGTYPKSMALFRKTKEEFYNLEKVAKSKNIDVSQERIDFYKNALIFCEHTFGINVLKYFGQSRAFDKVHFETERKTRKEYALAEKSWTEQENRVNAMRAITEKLKGRLDVVSDAIKNSPPDFKVSINKNKVLIKDDINEYVLSYEYRIIATKKMADFQRRYLTRFFDWSISDFGRNYYPEISGKKFAFMPKTCELKDNKWVVFFKTSAESQNEYGDIKNGVLFIWRENGEIRIALNCGYKKATAMLEAGNFVIETSEKGERYCVEQGGVLVNVDTDVVENANQILWSVDRYACIDNTALYTYDAPLISFGKNAIFEFNGGKPHNKKPIFVVNLFNNQWGTNFPQWIEGEFVFNFAIKNQRLSIRGRV